MYMWSLLCGALVCLHLHQMADNTLFSLLIIFLCCGMWFRWWRVRYETNLDPLQKPEDQTKWVAHFCHIQFLLISGSLYALSYIVHCKTLGCTLYIVNLAVVTLHVQVLYLCLYSGTASQHFAMYSTCTVQLRDIQYANIKTHSKLIQLTFFPVQHHDPQRVLWSSCFVKNRKQQNKENQDKSKYIQETHHGDHISDHVSEHIGTSIQAHFKRVQNEFGMHSWCWHMSLSCTVAWPLIQNPPTLSHLYMWSICNDSSWENNNTKSEHV